MRPLQLVQEGLPTRCRGAFPPCSTGLGCSYGCLASNQRLVTALPDRRPGWACLWRAPTPSLEDGREQRGSPKAPRPIPQNHVQSMEHLRPDPNGVGAGPRPALPGLGVSYVQEHLPLADGILRRETHGGCASGGQPVVRPLRIRNGMTDSFPL